MVKMTWFVLGIIVSVVVVDSIKTHLENNELRAIVESVASSAELRSKNVDSCIDTLNSVKETLQVVTLRAQIAALSRAQALNLFERARVGDDVAIQDLRELGLEVPPHQQPTAPKAQVARAGTFGQK